MKGIYYNYDLDECNWTFKQGVQPIGCGTHDKTRNTLFMLTKQYRHLEKKCREETQAKQ